MVLPRDRRVQQFHSRVGARLDAIQRRRMQFAPQLYQMAYLRGQRDREWALFKMDQGYLDKLALDRARQRNRLEEIRVSQGLLSARETKAFERQQTALQEQRVRRDEAEELFGITVAGGQTLSPGETTLAGDLLLAYPFMAIAVARRGSEVVLQRLAVRPETRGLLDLLRQIGALIDVNEVDGDAFDVAVRYSKQLRSTRVAGQRAERTLGQAALLAVVATQCPGEFVIRDLQPLRSGGLDRVAHIHSMLKLLGARVGEYPEGLVIQGGVLLRGAGLDCLGDAQMAMAWAAAGALAHGETQVIDTGCLETVYPDFFAALESLKE